MKIVEINYGFRGSTGNIMLNIADLVRSQGGTAYTFSAIKDETAPEGHRYFGTKIENLIHRFISIFTGISGTGSVKGTKALLAEIEKINPDVLHLHNLHGWFINLPLLFDFIRRKKIKTVWTLHDCWGFTAQCSHFIFEKCEKWKTGCYSCPRYRLYPYTCIDRTKKMWSLKKEWFTGIDNLTIVTPSQWLANLAKKSFLNEYPVKVINNGIDLSVFKPTESDFRKIHGISNEKKIVLGVASGWGMRKGLDVFVELSKRLDSEKYQIVLVGMDDNVDRHLPNTIILIHRTQNQQELAEIYTAADLFVNPTREENYPTVNMESIACGTPVITFKTGGSPEILDDTCGCVVEVDDIETLKCEIVKISNCNIYSKESCMKRSKSFEKNDRYMEYIGLFKEIMLCEGRNN